MPTLPKRERPKQTPFATIQNPFYNSRAWRNFSINHRKKHPLCVKCQEKGIITQAQLVDHIVPIRKGGNPFDTSNCQSLCHPCHNSKSGRGNIETMTNQNFETR
jgi:5-methylcytosine-specific restriction protein A